MNTNFHTESRMRENCTYGSMRGRTYPAGASRPTLHPSEALGGLNLDVIRRADWIVDLGPGGGDKGGRVVCEGPVPKVRACAESVTGRFLSP